MVLSLTLEEDIEMAATLSVWPVSWGFFLGLHHSSVLSLFNTSSPATLSHVLIPRTLPYKYPIKEISLSLLASGGIQPTAQQLELFQIHVLPLEWDLVRLVMIIPIWSSVGKMKCWINVQIDPKPVPQWDPQSVP